ncbi:hypothetical protein UPYG_G00025260 [Umbra pygmaea]|uniref:Uncharacterized protein n=1 Tax=Umbra pygmaea TaxID=75934 RepID=A0ABD0XLP5_UMBPY
MKTGRGVKSLNFRPSLAIVLQAENSVSKVNDDYTFNVQLEPSHWTYLVLAGHQKSGLGYWLTGRANGACKGNPLWSAVVCG